MSEGKKASNAAARTEIMARVRKNLAPVTTADATVRKAEAEEALRSRVRGPQPRMAGDLAERFVQKVESMSSTSGRIACREELPRAVARYLADNGLGATAAISPDLAALDWQEAGLAVEARGAVDADAVGITRCYCAIAETGTLMMISRPEMPPTLSLLPETHVVLVTPDDIVPSLEDAFFRLRQEFSGMPPAVNFISGPSRTADIEQTIVLGAHGPCRVHVIMLV